MAHSEQLWDRFARLASCCKIEIEHAGAWQVMVRHEQQGTVTGTGDDLLSAVEDALAQAEQKGWHKAPPAN